MHRSTTQRPGQHRVSRAAVKPDRLSALPDALLHHIMSFLKAWEVVSTCVLARRWRHLWASAPCIDLRVRHSSVRDANPPEEFSEFVDSLFLRRDASASVDMLRLRSSDDYVGFDERDANTWIRTAISRKARVIHLVGHRKGIASLDRVPFVSCHLKILKLSYARLDDRILGQLSSSCKSLEELDLKDCLVTGPAIVSTSLKTLIMLKCTFNWDFSITAPNLVLLRLITPSVRVPSFTNFGSLVTATIILDDSLLSVDFGYISDEDNFDETTDDDNHNDDKRENYKIHDDSSLSDDDFGYISDDDFGYISDDDFGYISDDDFGYISDDGDFDKFGFGYGFPKERYGRSRYKDNYDYGSDIDSDDNTYEYSAIANDAKYGYKGAKLSSGDGKYSGNSGRNYSKVLGGHNMLESLSTVTSLELLTDAGEVVLSRELKRCPTFSNLKTLSLGEWCMAADFDALIFLLQHSPNIKRLFLQLKLNFGMRKALETGIKLERRSFTCKDLRMVKIKCSKDDGRVHTLAHMFSANGIPLQYIYVRRSGNAHLRGQKFMRELAKQELDECGDDWM